MKLSLVIIATLMVISSASAGSLRDEAGITPTSSDLDTDDGIALEDEFLHEKRPHGKDKDNDHPNENKAAENKAAELAVQEKFHAAHPTRRPGTGVNALEAVSIGFSALIVFGAIVVIAKKTGDPRRTAEKRRSRCVEGSVAFMV